MVTVFMQGSFFKLTGVIRLEPFWAVEILYFPRTHGGYSYQAKIDLISSTFSPYTRRLFYLACLSKKATNVISVLTEVIRLAQRGLMVLSGCPRTYGGYSTRFRDLTYSRLFSPYTRGFLGGLNNITLNSTLFLCMEALFIYKKGNTHMQLGELILHYRPEGDQNNNQVRIWSQNNTTEGLLNGDKLLKFQIDHNNGKTYLTGPALTIQNAENTLTMRNIKNFYVTSDGILDVELE